MANAVETRRRIVTSSQHETVTQATFAGLVGDTGPVLGCTLADPFAGVPAAVTDPICQESVEDEGVHKGRVFWRATFSALTART